MPEQVVFPEQVVLDGGYASGTNLEEAKAMGVRDAVFHKGKGLPAAGMASSSPVAYGGLLRVRGGNEDGGLALQAPLRAPSLQLGGGWNGSAHTSGLAAVVHNLWVTALQKLKLKPA